jgi:hypothetical protein|tara:strand:+ start:261 stop:611 length:351 start_codon:yes stop_codon:yes gene_type:complete
MAKNLVVYEPDWVKSNKRVINKAFNKKSKIPKGDIFRKASREQKFLGRTFPRAIGGATKWLWRHPLTATAAWIGGELGYKKATKGRKWLTRRYQSLEGSQRKIARGKLYQGGHYDV